MHMKERITRALRVLAKLAGRLPWRKRIALAVLFIGTPFITGGVEYAVLNLVGLGIGALLVWRFTQSRAREQAMATRRRTR